ncbi:unnamed protein product [Gordionus sp. m RMFG-2023]|uniref:myosin-10-like isoform X2 n=1 Tax=Gordionus sp. m RMFG-2023 TaxID=3053472 RepID=UPI0030E5950F
MAENELKYLIVDKQVINDPASQAEWTFKKLVWIPHEIHGFIQASIKAEQGDDLDVECQETGKRLRIQKVDVQKMNPPKFTKVEDMADLTCLNEASVFHNLKDRYYSGLIYTYSGLFCVVVNPYKKLPIYTEKVIEYYKGKKRHEVPPHIFAIADSAYRSMLQEREDQSILCTGESGAGKTENTKKVIQYLAYVAASHRTKTSGNPSHSNPSTPTSNSGSAGELEKQLLKANPILESFGNAKTIKNDNSSRFGKFIRVNFDTSGYISGANIETYLLEKARVNRQAKNERSFHIFYQILLGANEKLKSELLLQNIKTYSYISNGNVLIPGIDDSSEFENTIAAMKIMGMENNITSILRIISAVLQFGNMEFQTERKSDQATLPDDTTAQKIACLLGLNVSEMIKALLKPKLKVGRDLVTKAQTKEQVEFSVEAIAKATYERLFRWIVSRINKSLDRTKRQGASFIGILDIAGFEIFEKNSFEQLCINYTNEKLQQLFNHTMFILEQEEYQREGIEWRFIDFGLDLQPTIDLLERRPMGILALLDEECWFPKATDQSLVDKLVNAHGTGAGTGLAHPKFAGPDFRDNAKTSFSVVHYAGKVDYSADLWLMKNMDPLNENLVSLLHNSQDPFVALIWKDADIVGMSSAPAINGFGGNSNSPAGGNNENSSPFFNFAARNTRKGMFRTVGQLYKDQLNKLMTTLHNTNPNFVRCILPNHEKKPGKIEAGLVLDQLRCNGVLEGIRICRQGFPNRIAFQEFRQRYEFLTPNAIPKGFMDGKKACEEMLKSLELDENLFRIGQSKIFFRAGVLAHLEEERDLKLTRIIVQFQAFCRGNLARKMYKRRLEQMNAIHILQRNMAAYLKLRNWAWWRLFTKVKPLLQVTGQEEKLVAKEEETKILAEKCEKQTLYVKELESKYQGLSEENNILNEQLLAEIELCAEAEEMRARLVKKKEELEENLNDLEARVEEEESKTESFLKEKKRLAHVLEETRQMLVNETETRAKMALEKSGMEVRLKRVEETLIGAQDVNEKLVKDRKNMEERLEEMSQQLTKEEEKGKHLSKQKNKMDNLVLELQDQLNRETAFKQELEKYKCKLETDLNDFKEQLNEKVIKVETLQTHLLHKEQELTKSLSKGDEDKAIIMSLQKTIRELESVIADLNEDIESEKKARIRAETQKRDLEDQFESLKSELEDTLDTNATQQEVRNKREAELSNLKKALEEESTKREIQIADLKAKYTTALEKLNDQIENFKKNKNAQERLKTNLEAENIDLVNETKSLLSARNEAEKRRKIAELGYSEVMRQVTDQAAVITELREQIVRLQTEIDSANHNLEGECLKSNQSAKIIAGLEQSVGEIQENLFEETRCKLSALAKVRDIESDLEREREKIPRLTKEIHTTTNQCMALTSTNSDLKAKLSEVSKELEAQEETKKNWSKDMEDAITQINALTLANDKLDKTKKKLQTELEDCILYLEKEKSKVSDHEKKQKKFDSLLSEQKSAVLTILEEKEACERECRDRETKVLSIQRELSECLEKLAASEKVKKQQALELDELVSNKDDAGKNYHELEKNKRSLENDVIDLKSRLEELEDELQISEDARLRLEVNILAVQKNFEKERSHKEEEYEERIRFLNKKLKGVETELDEERKQKPNYLSIKKKLETEKKELQNQLECAIRAKDETIKLSKKLQMGCAEMQKEYESMSQYKEESQAREKDFERKIKILESELSIAQQEASSNERYRKTATFENEELLEQIATLNNLKNQCMEDKRKFETKATVLEDELEEEQSNVEMAEERIARLQAQIDEINSQLAYEKAQNQKFEMQLANLDRINKEMKVKLSENDHMGLKKHKNIVTELEAKISELQDTNENNLKECQAVNKANRRLDKRIRELTLQRDEELKNAEQLKEQCEKSNSRYKVLKKQMEEMEEDSSKLNQQKRKLQREFDEQTESYEAINRELIALKNKFRSMSSRTSRFFNNSTTAKSISPNFISNLINPSSTLNNNQSQESLNFNNDTITTTDEDSLPPTEMIGNSNNINPNNKNGSNPNIPNNFSTFNNNF